MDGLEARRKCTTLILIGGLAATMPLRAFAGAGTQPADPAASAVALTEASTRPVAEIAGAVSAASTQEETTLAAKGSPAATVAAGPAKPGNAAGGTSHFAEIAIQPGRDKQNLEMAGMPKSSPGTIMMNGLYTILQVGGALLAVLGILFVGRALMRRFAPSMTVNNGKGVIETLARYPLAKNQQLVLVRVGSQLVLLNQGRELSQQVLVIQEQGEVARIIGQIEGNKPDSIQRNFNKLLANAAMELEAPDTKQAYAAADAIETSEDLDNQLDEMAAAKRQLMELREQVRSVRENLPV